MSEAGRKLGDCGVLRVAACVRWPRRGPAVCMQCKSGHAALAINIATTSLQMHKQKHKASGAPGSGRTSGVERTGICNTRQDNTDSVLLRPVIGLADSGGRRT